MPKVSIIIPAYNCAEFIGRTIDSVLSQTYKDYEIIIVNDGSTDETEQAVSGYLKKYSDTIRYFVQENGGSAKARNKAIAHSRGQYIAFLDSDDLWRADKLEKQMSIINENPGVNFIFSNAKLISHSGEDTGKSYINSGVDALRKYSLFDQLLLKDYIPFSSVLLKKDTFNERGNFDERWKGCEDYDFLLKIAKFINPCEISDELASYRLSRQSKSKNLVCRHQSTISLVKQYLNGHKPADRMYERLMKERLSESYWGLGYAYYEKNEIQEARNAWIQSVIYWPFSALKKYLLIAVSLLPLTWIGAIRHLNRNYR